MLDPSLCQFLVCSPPLLVGSPPLASFLSPHLATLPRVSTTDLPSQPVYSPPPSLSHPLLLSYLLAPPVIPPPRRCPPHLPSCPSRLPLRPRAPLSLQAPAASFRSLARRRLPISSLGMTLRLYTISCPLPPDQPSPRSTRPVAVLLYSAVAGPSIHLYPPGRSLLYSAAASRRGTHWFQ